MIISFDRTKIRRITIETHALIYLGKIQFTGPLTSCAAAKEYHSQMAPYCVLRKIYFQHIMWSPQNVLDARRLMIACIMITESGHVLDVALLLNSITVGERCVQFSLDHSVGTVLSK